MSLEQKVQIIQAAASGLHGVRDLTKKLRWRTSSIVSLSRELQEERLIDFHIDRKPNRGRPKRSIVCTPLGLDFLEAHGKQAGKLDNAYLMKRARQAEVLTILQAIQSS